MRHYIRLPLILHVIFSQDSNNIFRSSQTNRPHSRIDTTRTRHRSPSSARPVQLVPPPRSQIYFISHFYFRPGGIKLIFANARACASPALNIWVGPRAHFGARKARITYSYCRVPSEALRQFGPALLKLWHPPQTPTGRGKRGVGKKPRFSMVCS